MSKNMVMAPVRLVVFLVMATALCFAVALAGSGGNAQADTQGSAPTGGIVCPGGQCFTDIPPANGFFDNINALYTDGIISGYPCGGAGEPCDSESRPYYRPGNTVTRQQMSKFVDLGRRNIAEAVGVSLYLTDTTGPALIISSTSGDAVSVRTSTGAEGVQSDCTRADSVCYGFRSASVTGTRPAWFSGGRGTVLNSADDDQQAADINSSGTGSYGAEIDSVDYRGLRITSNPGWYTLFVESVGSPVAAYIDGNMTVTGTCTGCEASEVILQNVGDSPLQVGDLVSVVGSGPAVVGDRPVLLVQKATGAYNTAVAGIVGNGMYVPDAATRAAYLEETEARRVASNARSQLMADAEADGAKVDEGQIAMPAATISDAVGNAREDKSMTTIATNGYAKLVTAGSFQSLKVDASFGAIKAGDLLTTSPNAGYAMKVTDKAEATGAIIGKAMGDLSEGTGTIAVLITLK